MLLTMPLFLLLFLFRLTKVIIRSLPCARGRALCVGSRSACAASGDRAAKLHGVPEVVAERSVGAGRRPSSAERSVG
uniref:Secreted protein n=1 Tax=Oryza brachyantha TaxID=4533 RepID=J3LHP8_ORYBR